MHHIKLKEAKIDVDHATTGSKRKLHQGQDSDRPPHCQKTCEDCDGETEDEDKFDVDGMEFTEPGDEMSSTHA